LEDFLDIFRGEAALARRLPKPVGQFIRKEGGGEELDFCRRKEGQPQKLLGLRMGGLVRKEAREKHRGIDDGPCRH
jgi:hypothetical protein